MQKHYNKHAESQRAPEPLNNKVLERLHSPENFCEYLGDEKRYWDYLIYFQEEIDKKGYQVVINEYLFGGDKRADALLIRMFAGKVLFSSVVVLLILNLTGFLHPLIHLGFGIEFEQPAIVAEALAQAAVVSRLH